MNKSCSAQICKEFCEGNLQAADALCFMAQGTWWGYMCQVLQGVKLLLCWGFLCSAAAVGSRFLWEVVYQSPAVKNTGDVDVCVCGWGESQDCSAMGVVGIYI